MAIVIAARPAWLEKVTATPLDELYKWHRTLGIWAAVLTLFHFFTKDVMRPVLSLFTLEPVPKIVRDELTGFDAFWAWMRGFAVESSEWATFLGLVLFVVSFISIVRYHKWLSSHKLFSVLFLILAVHCIRLTEAEDFLTPFGLINVAVTVIGCYYSLELLIRGAGREKSVSAEIVDVNTNNRLTLITVKPEKPVDIRYGEFAFLGTSGHEKHPFSVAGINDDGTLTFAVKALGDYTRDVVPMLQKGERVIVEGPWGGSVRISQLKSSCGWRAASVSHRSAPGCRMRRKLRTERSASFGASSPKSPNRCSPTSKRWPSVPAFDWKFLSRPRSDSMPNRSLRVPFRIRSRCVPAKDWLQL